MATTTIPDYERLTRDAALIDRSNRGKLLLTGAEVGEFLQGQLTNDVESLAPGTGCYAALLSHKGKLRADARVLRGDDWFLLDSEPIGLAALRKTARTYSLGRDVKVEDVTEERSLLSLVGPASAARLDVQPPAEEHSFVTGAHGIYVTTDLGVDVICPAEQRDAVRDALEIDAASEDAAECLRIEAGRPRHGVDMDADTMPEEAGITERAVSFTKGCYVGQETVARLHYRGRPNRHLRGLALSARADHGDEVRAGERVIGTVGSECVSPRHGPIALAILRREVAPGDTVEVGPDAIAARVVSLPFRDAA